MERIRRTASRSGMDGNDALGFFAARIMEANKGDASRSEASLLPLLHLIYINGYALSPLNPH